MSLVPWKIDKPEALEMAGVSIPDHGGLLVNESEVLLYLSDLERKRLISKARTMSILCAYCVALRLGLEEQEQAIFQGLRSASVLGRKTPEEVKDAVFLGDLALPETVQVAVEELLPPNATSDFTNELASKFIGTRVKKETSEGKEKGSRSSGAKSTGSSKSTTQTPLSLVEPGSDISQSA